MKINQRIFFIMLFPLVIILATGETFPDKMPELTRLKEYSPEKLNFSKTSFQDFKSFIPSLSSADTEVYNGGLTIIKTYPPDKKTFSLVRTAFQDDKLDWAEFTLNENPEKSIPIAKFTSLIGKPESINKTYDRNNDYYNYGFFNISADKSTKMAKTITYFAKPPQKAAILKTAAEKALPMLPKKGKRFYAKFPEFVPGAYLESEFTLRYPHLLSYLEYGAKYGESPTSMYVMTDELGEVSYYYEKAILKFESGLLTWINLIPKNISFYNFYKTVKTPYKIEKLDQNYNLYDFYGFVAIVDKKTGMVKSIGIYKEGVKL